VDVVLDDVELVELELVELGELVEVDGGGEHACAAVVLVVELPVDVVVDVVDDVVVDDDVVDDVLDDEVLDVLDDVVDDAGVHTVVSDASFSAASEMASFPPKASILVMVELWLWRKFCVSVLRLSGVAVKRIGDPPLTRPAWGPPVSASGKR